MDTVRYIRWIASSTRLQQLWGRNIATVVGLVLLILASPVTLSK